MQTLLKFDRPRSSLATRLSMVWLCLSAALVAGCADDPRPLPWLMVGAGALWSWQPKTPEDIGYTLATLIEQRPERGTGTCVDLPASVRVTVNGTEVPLARDDSNCAKAQLTLGPFLRDQSVHVEARDGDQIVAEGTFEHLMPGIAASLASPADGRVRAGDEVVMVPPVDLPTSHPLISIFPMADPQLGVTRLYSSDADQRLADGIHFRVPAFVGRAAVVSHGMPYSPDASFTCAGFAVCTAIADDTVGPIFITEGP